jgi:hypothetical protein
VVLEGDAVDRTQSCAFLLGVPAAQLELEKTSEYPKGCVDHATAMRIVVNFVHAAIQRFPVGGQTKLILFIPPEVVGERESQCHRRYRVKDALIQLAKEHNVGLLDGSFLGLFRENSMDNLHFSDILFENLMTRISSTAADNSESNYLPYFLRGEFLISDVAYYTRNQPHLMLFFMLLGMLGA